MTREDCSDLIYQKKLNPKETNLMVHHPATARNSTNKIMKEKDE